MPIKFDVVQGERENIAFGGKRTRRSTVLMRVYTDSGTLAFSKRAFLLGSILVACQVLDGLLTYTGLLLFGVKMEGNGMLRELMHVYGMLPALVAVKLFAILTAMMLMFYAHKRRWIRPLLAMVIVVYLMLALIPWALIITGSGLSDPG